MMTLAVFYTINISINNVYLYYLAITHRFPYVLLGISLMLETAFSREFICMCYFFRE